ncbi:MAG: hypothetical protein GQ576_05745 [Methanococcoides sp.]|nr:hypothetical protein [Methanococcoides sp.]
MNNHIDRISTGIPGLDTRLDGGYPQGESFLVTGTQGTGKTIFGLHFLEKACSNNKRCVLIATEEMPYNLVKQANMFGFDLMGYIESGLLQINRVYEQRTNYVRNKTGKMYDPTKREIGLMDLLDYIPASTDVAIIDNIGVFTLEMTPRELRDKLDTMIQILAERNCTALFIMDDATHEITHNIADYSVCGSINLMMKDNPENLQIERFIKIIKMRRTCIPMKLMKFNITPKGINLENPLQPLYCPNVYNL